LQGRVSLSVTAEFHLAGVHDTQSAFSGFCSNSTPAR
jgi:hypothetical protein